MVSQFPLNTPSLSSIADEKQFLFNLEKSVKSGQFAWQSLSCWEEKYFFKARQDLIDEYKAKTPSELLLIDASLVAFFRHIKINKIFNSFLDTIVEYKDESKPLINAIKELNKAMDNANQQMITALTCLKELRRQPIKVRVQTQKAYFAQNQQINEDRP